MVRTLPLWTAELDSLHRKVGRCFARLEQRSLAQLAAQFGHRTPDRVQRLLNAAVWDVDMVGEDRHSYAVEHLRDDEAVLIAPRCGYLVLAASVRPASDDLGQQIWVSSSASAGSVA